jgi:hypothetical protein
MVADPVFFALYKVLYNAIELRGAGSVHPRPLDEGPLLHHADPDGRDDVDQ